MSLRPSLRRIRQLRHQLKGRQVSGHAKDVIFSLLQGVDKQNLQQREVEIEQHVYNAASHQHPDYVGMNEGWWNLGKVKEFLEQCRKRESKPDVKLFFREGDDASFSFLSRHDILPLIQKFHNHAIGDAESIPKLLYTQLVYRLLVNIAGPDR